MERIRELSDEVNAILFTIIALIELVKREDGHETLEIVVDKIVSHKKLLANMDVKDRW